MTKPKLRTVLFLALAIGAGLGLPARPAAAQQTVKTLVNNTWHQLRIKLIVRMDQEPGKTCAESSEKLDPHDEVVLRIGMVPDCMFLDRLDIAWVDSGQARNTSYQVNSRGDFNDDLLNTHAIFTFHTNDRGKVVLSAQ